ncbi:MAG: EamA family transporter, partial [Muribaculaceae bacterium]|nr:EamA family transporter [Muribaculaceae bacterium]
MSDTDKSSILSHNKLVWFHLAALTTIIFWGSSFVSTRVLLDNGLHAVEIYIYRFLLAYLFIIFVSHKRLWANNLRDEILLALCGLTSGSIYFIAENFALKYTLSII